MPGYLGGGSSSGGVGGEIRFPTEFIDPVTKLRVSQPENLIDTDFEYGLQPTKWETVELINNTPSFFSKSGDTTIPGITAITTNQGTREITVVTALEHGLAVGIPINVQGTKSTTADGSYIINSIPNEFTFTYLCKDIQPETASIEDLYSSIITGEFFQGSQLRLSDDQGIITDGATPLSTLTVKTASTHGFGLNTPFYFLNLNSTISQEFPAANNTTRSFDASNSATAQTFDGSNTASAINIDLSNAPVVGGATSSVASTNPTADTITVNHSANENFAGSPLGTPLYYDVVAGSGFFAANPRGVVFLKSTGGLGTIVSTFQVSEVPDGPVIDIQGSLSGTFQLANQARTFAGNNVNPLTQVDVSLVNDPVKEFDGANELGTTGTVIGYSGSNVTVESASPLGWYQGTMVLYSTNGTPANGLTNNTTYFVDFFAPQSGSNFSSFTLKPLPTGSVISSISGGTGTQTFKQIGVSLDKNVFHLKDNGYQVNDMLRYDFPENGRFVADEIKNFYFVQTKYDAHNFTLSHTLGEVTPLTISRTGTDAGTPITPTSVTAIGFTDPVTWAVTSGTLPTGLTLNTSTGVVSGTPDEVIPSPGREVVITLTDATGAQASQTITFQFNQPPFLYSFSSATFTNGGATGRFGPNITQARSGVGNPPWANDYLNMNIQGIQRWTVPQSATYRIEVAGATGSPYGNAGARRGWGYRLRGDFALTQGQIIQIAVGQEGTGNGGGGGGTFVVWEQSSNSHVPLIIAGGGGAQDARYSAQPEFHDATDAESGRPGGGAARGGSAVYFGGSNGQGGSDGGSNGGAGGGFFTDGGGNPGSFGGFGFLRGGSAPTTNSLVGGDPDGDGTGGFGGGAGTSDDQAAGGGGYSGGGGTSEDEHGGGGGSYFNTARGTNRVNIGAWTSGHGFCTITKL